MDPASPQFLALARQYPTAFDLRERARRIMPNFAFEYMDGGAGAVDLGVRRNWTSLDNVELAPRYGKVVQPPSCEATLFGRPYNAPIGVSPIGGPGTAFPGAETYLAKAAQKLKVPYTLGLLSGITVEEAAQLAPDVLWFQLYRFSRNDHQIGLDLTRRAAAAGVHVLVLTIDTPIRTTRPRETKSGIQNPFKTTMRLRMDALSSPRWLASLARHGMPRFTSLKPYMKPGATFEETTQFIRREQGLDCVHQGLHNFCCVDHLPSGTRELGITSAHTHTHTHRCGNALRCPGFATRKLGAHICQQHQVVGTALPALLQRRRVKPV